MSNRNRTPRTAALLLSIALGGASLTMTTAADAAPVTHSAAHAKAAVVAETVVTRLSAAKGVAGDTVLIQGNKLATWTAGSPGSWTKKAVKFGETTVLAADVTVLSAKAIVVEVPAGTNGTVLVLVGDAVKGPKFTYAAPITITTDQDDLDDVSADLVSETGLAGSLAGTNFTTATKVLVGGKAAKITKGGVTATKVDFTYPAGLAGVQDVTVVDGGKTYYVGYVTYHGKPVTITGVTGTAYKEQASVVEVAGTNLDLVTGVTFNGVKATFKVTKGVSDKISVTIPVGDVVTDGDLVVTTKYEATASFEVDRVAAPVPTVTAVSTVTAATAGEVTLTGTNLTGLKKVVFTAVTGGKVYNGAKISVTSATSAKVTLPALPPGSYTVAVTAISATASADFSVTVATPDPAVTTVTVSADKKTVTIVGTWLGGATEVEFTPGTGSAVTATTGITATGTTKLVVVLASALTAETWDVLVTTPAGDSGTSGDNKLTIAA